MVATIAYQGPLFICEELYIVLRMILCSVNNGENKEM